MLQLSSGFVPWGDILCVHPALQEENEMSFLKRLVIAILLLVLLGIPLFAMYYDSVQTLSAQSDDEQPIQQDSLNSSGRK